VFDQKRDSWFVWDEKEWNKCYEGDEPVINHIHFAGTGTRYLEDNGRKAVVGLFERSFA
jgi:hypothetical protein